MRTYATICACCGITFQARSILAAYCNVNCRVRAAYCRKKGKPTTAANRARNWTQPIRPSVEQLSLVGGGHGTEERIWRGTAIQRRQADGFVNATAMCQANRREWFTYARSARTQEYIAALASYLGVTADLRSPIDGSPQNPATLIHTITTGPNPLRGTWIHPRLAIDLARWISPAFAVWMDGWFLETIALPPAAGPLEPGIHVVAGTMTQARQLWGAMLRTELLATLDTYSVGHPAVATPKVKYHLAPAT